MWNMTYARCDALLMDRHCGKRLRAASLARYLERTVSGIRQHASRAHGVRSCDRAQMSDAVNSMKDIFVLVLERSSLDYQNTSTNLIEQYQRHKHPMVTMVAELPRGKESTCAAF